MIRLFGEEYSYNAISLCLSVSVAFFVGCFLDFQIGSLMIGANIVAGLAMIIYRMDKDA